MKKYVLALALLLTLSLTGGIGMAQGIYQLWGTTTSGGSEDQGLLFTAKSDGAGLQIIHEFCTERPGKSWEGNRPVAYNGKLYSVLRNGGFLNQGMITEYDPVADTYIKKVDLATIGGAGCESAMIVYNNKLYGTTYEGGANDKGVLFEYDPVSNILVKKHDFADATGSGDMGDLVVYNNKLYGITLSGGANGDGVIFEYDPASGVYTKKIDFDDIITGSATRGGMAIYNSMLWGISTHGGAGGGGVIFSYNPATNLISPKASLSAINSSEHFGTPAILNNKLYGIASQGGANGYGAIFEFNPANNALTDKFDFTALTANNRCRFTVYNNILYSLSLFGGTSDNGAIFSYEPATNTYATKINLDHTSGTTGEGSLLLYNNKLYGWTYAGAAYNRGSLIAYDPIANTYVKNVELGGPDVYYPNGNLLYYNNKIYGTTIAGGDSAKGGIYEYDLATENYNVLASLSEVSGQFSARGGVIVYNNKLYTATNYGGSNDEGALFEYDLTTGVLTVKHDFLQSTGRYPNSRLTVYNGKIYGTCKSGSTLDLGNIFQFDPATGTYTEKVVMDPTKGTKPVSGMILYNNKLYGVNSEDGTNGDGTLFEYYPAANGFTVLANFNYPITGGTPVTELVYYNGSLWGNTAYLGGYEGTLYEYNLSGGTLTKKHDFIQVTGRMPLGTLTLLNGKLYGMANVGGGASPAGGVIYEYDPLLDTYIDRTDFAATNGRFPQRAQLLPVPAKVAPGSAGSCTNATGGMVAVNAANSNSWIAFTDAQGRAIAELNPNGNILGNVSLSFYVHGGNTRQDVNGQFYMDRNIFFNVQQQPTSPVSIRLYVRKIEYENLKNTVGSGINNVNDLAVFQNNDPCSYQMIAPATHITTTVGNWGSDYVLSAVADSLGSFYFGNAALTLLPVSLYSFTGQALPQANRLEWDAACTADTYFELERSTDGGHFERLTQIAAPTNNDRQTFRYDDAMPPEELSYYRLRITGHSVYSNVVQLNRTGRSTTEASIHPNPVHGNVASLRISSMRETDIYTAIFDQNGKKLHTQHFKLSEGDQEIPVSVENLAPGIYSLRVMGDQWEQVLKLIKE